MPAGDTTLRPEIAHSWWRSELSGLTPAGPQPRVEPDAVDRRGRLRTAAGPVLAELARQLGETDFCVVLADRAARITELSGGGRVLRDRLESLGVVSGGVFLEETTGTNSLATAYELRRGVAVHGEEHYLEPFKRFSCYGHPITHPVTRRLVGVLDITCPSAADSPLLAPLVARAARDVEDGLLRTARAAERRMLAAFRAAAGPRRPVLVLGEGVVLASPAAVELLDPVDHLTLRELAAGAESGGAGAERELSAVPLSSGRTVSVRWRPVDGSDGVLFDLTELPETGAPAHRPGAPVPGTAVYIGGAPGTGRTTAARSLADAAGVGVRTLDASEAVVRGDAHWLARLERAAAEGPGLLLVEDAHLLSETCAVRLRRVMARRPGPWTVLTGAPLAGLTGPHAVLAADCPVQVELPGLRERTAELPGLVRAMIDGLGLGGRLHFTPAALAALSAQPFPGELRELHAVVRDVAARRSAGGVTVQDLPERYRFGPGRPGLTPLERAEHDAITAALLESGGNKLRAARRLGISRTTLYSRMRALRITA
ncbi:sigma-54-dependent Fis family transcriptional regulator [Streptomyces qinzhouensis]|uniref:AAA family ATPase n=1 Tax=Streptomyces qinzhouensis TaxID=2599401 RepID=A0A5B8J361_9ACTN|nr:helix-turn-helix domain-containing protein [Streptomyces qinzhouensis]QDY75616.1 AAA family ATPase [Streptomyces qinzhouensis]